MAKRIIHECDLTKQEFNPDEDTVFTLSIVKKGRKSPMKFEVCASAAEKLLAQLNGKGELPEDWSFARNVPSRRAVVSEELDIGSNMDDGIDDDSNFVARKKAELREEGIIGNEEEERELEGGAISQALGAKQENCVHMNKSGIKVTSDHKKYRTCNACGKAIPEQSSGDRTAYLSATPPKGVNIRDLE